MFHLDSMACPRLLIAIPTATSAQGLNNLAVIYTSQGRAQEALQTLQAATLADPNYAEVCSWLRRAPRACALPLEPRIFIADFANNFLLSILR